MILGFWKLEQKGDMEEGTKKKKKTPCRGFTLEVKRHVVQQAPKCYVVDFFIIFYFFFFIFFFFKVVKNIYSICSMLMFF